MEINIPAGWNIPVIAQKLGEWEGALAIFSNDIDQSIDQSAEFEAKPTLQWVNGSKVISLFVNNGDDEPMTTEEFLEWAGISIQSTKSALTMCKRISRLMRPHVMWATEARVEVMQHADLKTWDGAMLVSRKWLMRQRQQIKERTGLSARAKRRWLRELRTATRWEMTVQTHLGQFKGHALVIEENLGWDILVPNDPKPEITSKQTTIGFAPVHGKDAIELDVQSMINLSEVFPVEYLAEKLEERINRYIDALVSGELNKKLASNEPDAYWLNRYCGMGGDIRWFPGTIRAAMKQYAKTLERYCERLRCPIDGVRRYVTVDEVAGVTVKPGHTIIDKDSFYVAASDWPEIAAKTGGADQDDAYWLTGIIVDGVKYVLAWRSPNQRGEYVILKPQGDVPLKFREVGSLPKTKEHRYLYSLTPAPITGPYSEALIAKTIKVAMNNRFTLGRYCNFLMGYQETFGSLPDVLPAPLEDVIDASVKTGADMTQVNNWITRAQADVMDSGVALPRTIASRLVGKNNAQYAIITDKGFICEVEDMLNKKTDAFIEKIPVYASMATPPMDILRWKGYRRDGWELRKAFMDALGEDKNSYKNASLAAKKVLDASKDPGANIVGAIYNTFVDRTLKFADGVLWSPEVVETTLRTLQEECIIGTDDASISLVVIPVNYLWFNLTHSMGMHACSLPREVRNSSQLKAAAAEYFRKLRTFGAADENHPTADGLIVGKKMDALSLPESGIIVEVHNDDNVYFMFVKE